MVKKSLLDYGMGALLGDDSEVGCNTSLQPGTILGKKAVVGPNLPFAGTLGESERCVELRTARK